MSQFATVPFSIVLIIFTLQAINIQISKLSNLVTNSLQQLGVVPVLEWFVFVLNWVMLPTLVGAYLYYCFLMHAKIISNLSAIIFVSSSFYLVNVLKLIFGELRPKMSAVLSETELNIASCEMDFGMPSSYIFMSVCFGYLLRRNFFVVKTQAEAVLNAESDGKKEVEDSFAFSERRYRFKDCRRFIINHELRYNHFNIGFLVFVISTVVSKMLLGSHTITQSVLTVVIAVIWATFYYNFIELGLKNFHHDLIVAPKTRGRSVAIFSLLNVFCFGFNLFLFTARRFIYNPDHYRKIKAAYLLTCPKNLMLGHSNFYYALSLFFPMFVILSLYFTPFRADQYNSYTKRLSFDDLSHGLRVLRVAIWTVPMAGMWAYYLATDYVVNSLGAELFWLKCLIFVAFLAVVAVMIVLGYPYLFMKAGVLLKNEYIYKKAMADEDDEAGEKKKVKRIVRKRVKKSALEALAGDLPPEETAGASPTVDPK